MRAGDFRDRSRFISMGQGPAGDGSYLTFHCADLDMVTSALGSRGYRAAQVEAGWALERLHLAVYALGIGATGLTCFDSEAKAFLGVRSEVMTEVAVGMPAHRQRRGALGAAATHLSGRAIEMYTQRVRQLRGGH